MSPQTRNLTILLTDIKGFTDKTSHKTRADIQNLLDRHKELVLPILSGRGGSLVKTIGDAFLMTFESPTDAVLAGIAVQDALLEYNKDKPEPERIEIRIAINSGEVNLADGDIFGEPVNITARIEGLADAGEVFFTEAVYLAMNKTEVPSSEVGLLQLKGIPEKVRVYKVRRETPVGSGQALPARGSSAPAPKAAAAPAPGGLAPIKRRALALAMDFLLCSALAATLAGGRDRPVNIVGDKDGSEAAVEYADGGGGVKISQDGVATSPRKMGSDPLPLFWVIYNALFLTLLGATPGKKLLRLRVVAAEGGPLGWQKALGRSLMSVISGIPLLLGYLWAIRDPQRRTWHDLAADTRVIWDPPA